MAKSIWMAFADFLKRHGYSTTMWESGYSCGDANEVCRHVTAWMQQDLSLPGECLMLWAKREGTSFSGDSELIYAVDDNGLLLPNPFLEGDAEGFITALQKIMEGKSNELFVIALQSRVLYNAQ
ncbi:MAG: hypothetical protein OWT28_06160 [Firmicutes bacterium]|nr:hypothetical protein [Bacillota bacterium]